MGSTNLLMAPPIPFCAASSHWLATQPPVEQHQSLSGQYQHTGGLPEVPVRPKPLLGLLNRGLGLHNRDLECLLPIRGLELPTLSSPTYQPLAAA